ncbi:hypothetical protein DPMN_005671 [Dreissena polymorpha]|uniref:Uncharacterized protein n=1 Tax=Dreissena polymorpha TaxID=45954 RepID=A0A9D4RUR5_DREPO|nr:hypothetical protein DPMN_005671 [Dreissena polymorpha]
MHEDTPHGCFTFLPTSNSDFTDFIFLPTSLIKTNLKSQCYKQKDIFLSALSPGCVYGGDSCYTSYLQTSYCTYGCCYSSYSTYASCCTLTLSVGSWVGIGVGTAVVIGVCVLVYYLWRRQVAARRAATVASLAQGAQAPYPLWQLTTVPSLVGNLPPQYNLPSPVLILPSQYTLYPNFGFTGGYGGSSDTKRNGKEERSANQIFFPIRRWLQGKHNTNYNISKIFFCCTCHMPVEE